MDRALAGVPGIFPCADDVKVQGSSGERHNINLLETVQKAKTAEIRFNPDKCNIKKEKVEYFGRIVSAKGVEPFPKKDKSVLKLQAPINKQELSSFMGTVNFVSTFIPNLAKKTHLMGSLLKKQVSFSWSSDMQKEFEDIKLAISNSVNLTHFDPNKSATVETDGSLKSIGAALIQENKPVKFLSKSLTQSESGYSNIERKLLAILFVCLLATPRLHIWTHSDCPHRSQASGSYFCQAHKFSPSKITEDVHQAAHVQPECEVLWSQECIVRRHFLPPCDTWKRQRNTRSRCYHHPNSQN